MKLKHYTPAELLYMAQRNVPELRGYSVDDIHVCDLGGFPCRYWMALDNYLIVFFHRPSDMELHVKRYTGNGEIVEIARCFEGVSI